MTNLFLILIFILFAQEQSSSPSVQLKPAPGSKIIISGQEATPGSVHELRPGDKITIMSEQGTGSSNSTPRSNRATGAKRSRSQQASSNGANKGADKSIKDSPKNEAEKVMQLIIDKQAEIESDKYITIKVELPDGKVQYVTTLGIGILQVVKDPGIEPNKETTLEARLALNRIIPESIRKLGGDSPFTYFIRADYSPQHPQLFSAILSTESKYEVTDETTQLSWKWTIDPKPGFKSDTAFIDFWVECQKNRKPASEHKLTPGQQIEWSELPILGISGALSAFLKEHLLILTNALTALISAIALIISTRANNGRVEAERDKFKIEKEKIEAERDKLRAEIGKIERETIKPDVEPNKSRDHIDNSLKGTTNRDISNRRKSPPKRLHATNPLVRSQRKLVIPSLDISASSNHSWPGLTLDRGILPHSRLDQIYRSFSDGYQNLDASSVASLYCDDALLLAYSNDIYSGRQVIKEYFSSRFSSAKENGAVLNITFRIMARRISGLFAYDVGVYTLVESGDSMKHQKKSGNFVALAKLVGDSTWRLQVYSYSVGDSQTEKPSQSSL
jgi:ketosteroid isomerase-like protein